MKTLGKEVTQEFFKDSDGYDKLVAAWGQLVNDKAKKLRAVHYLIYAVLRGKDWKMGFVPVTSRVKLENGMWAHQTAEKTLYDFFSIVQYGSFHRGEVSASEFFSPFLKEGALRSAYALIRGTLDKNISYNTPVKIQDSKMGEV